MDTAPEVVSLLREEAERMRGAVAGAEAGAKVDMSVEQFLRLAEMITLLCDLVPRSTADAAAERGGLALRNGALAQIESEMQAAEAAFTDADSRLKSAERDRNAALEAVNRHQTEIDRLVTRWRNRSPEGSNWHRAMQSDKDVLILGHDDSSEVESALIRMAGSDTQRR